MIKENKGGIINMCNSKKLTSDQIHDRFFDIIKEYNGEDENKKAMAATEAIELLQNYVHFILQRYYSTYHKYFEDMFQEGVLGILANLGKYDPSRSKPTTFFHCYIMHNISDYVHTEINKTTPHYATNISLVEKAIEFLTEQGKSYTEKDIAIETGLTLETVNKCMRRKNNADELYYDSDEFLDSQLTKRSVSPEEEFIESERVKTLYDAIGSLDPEEAQVIMLKFGLGGEVLSYKNISERLGIPIEKVRRLKHKGIKNLRNKESVRNLFYDNFSDLQDILDSTDISIVPEEAADIMMRDLEAVEINF